MFYLFASQSVGREEYRIAWFTETVIASELLLCSEECASLISIAQLESYLVERTICCLSLAGNVGIPDPEEWIKNYVGICVPSVHQLIQASHTEGNNSCAFRSTKQDSIAVSHALEDDPRFRRFVVRMKKVLRMVSRKLSL